MATQRKPRFERHVWANRSLAPIEYIFEVKVSASASGVSIWRNDKRIAHSRYKWGPAKRDALAMAAHRLDPKEATSVIHYLFGDDYLTALFAESTLKHRDPY